GESERGACHDPNGRLCFDLALLCYVLVRQDLPQPVAIMPDTATPLLEMRHVNLRYEDTWALHDISLRLNPGETRIILGAAGSGKTSLLKAVIGLVHIGQ